MSTRGEVTTRTRWLAGVHVKVPYGVALTVDADLSASQTPALLDLLGDLDVRATFFLRGDEVADHAEVVLRMRAGGHGIGSRVPISGPGHDSIAAGIESALLALQLVLGRRTRLVRPVGRLDLGAAVAMRRARLDSWLWSVDATHGVDTLRERDVVRFGEGSVGDVENVVELARNLGLDFVAL